MDTTKKPWGKKKLEAIMMAQISEGITSKGPDVNALNLNMEQVYVAIQPHLKVLRALFGQHMLSDIIDFGSSVCYPFGAVIGCLLSRGQSEFLNNPLTLNAIIIKIAEQYFLLDAEQNEIDDLILHEVEQATP